VEVWEFDQMPWPRPGPRIVPGKSIDLAYERGLYEGHLALARRTDELGYDGFCLTEHHYGSLDPSPNVMAAWVAAHTERTKIVLLGNCLPLHGHPVRLAEELAMVDVLSGGRLVSGFIRGGAFEFPIYNIDPAKSRSLFEESWELIVRAWTADEPFSWHGEHYDYDVVSIVPRPLQQPHPPIVAAANTAESIEWAAQKRVPLITSFSPTEQIAETMAYYRKYAQEQCGWTPGPEHIGLSRHTYVSTTDAKAQEEVEEHVLEVFGSGLGFRVEQDTGNRSRMTTERSWSYKSGPHINRPRGLDWDQVMDGGYCIVGSPDTVIRRIKEQQKMVGNGLFMTYLPFGTMQPAKALKSLELFGKEVLPNLR
jgi:alkanesulfonate monooxygenase SsuD/methylene tetrahydromethanopterin reductase-like flavin-dependent oxidoreductase (luciferase family)